MTFNLELAKKICEGLYAVTDSIVEHFEGRAIQMFPYAIAEIERLLAEKELIEIKLEYAIHLLSEEKRRCPRCGFQYRIVGIGTTKVEAGE